jgi:hypothetical protein
MDRVDAMSVSNRTCDAEECIWDNSNHPWVGDVACPYKMMHTLPIAGPGGTMWNPKPGSPETVDNSGGIEWPTSMGVITNGHYLWKPAGCTIDANGHKHCNYDKIPVGICHLKGQGNYQ